MNIETTFKQCRRGKLHDHITIKNWSEKFQTTTSITNKPGGSVRDTRKYSEYEPLTGVH